MRRQSCRRVRDTGSLLLAEGHAVGALIHGGITFVGTHQNPVQGAVVFIAAVMGTLIYGALNGLVGMAIHNRSSFAMYSAIVCAMQDKICA